MQRGLILSLVFMLASAQLPVRAESAQAYWRAHLAVTPPASPERQCLDAIETVAAEMDVPRLVLLGIGLTEAQRPAEEGRRTIWPWTLHDAKAGAYFPSKHAARARLQGLVEAGQTRIDIGCLQVNWHWHGAGLEEAEDLLDPFINVRTAAGFLTRLHREFGTWEAASAAYHSRNEDRSAAYLTRVKAQQAALENRSVTLSRPKPHLGALFTTHRPQAVVPFGPRRPLLTPQKSAEEGGHP